MPVLSTVISDSGSQELVAHLVGRLQQATHKDILSNALARSDTDCGVGAHRGIFMKCPVLVVILFAAGVASAQTESARISGRVTDLSGAVIVGAECKITNLETSVSTTTNTNEDGIYVIPDLRPATYRLTIQKEGFRTVVQPSLQVYVQDAVNENFTLAIGPTSDSVTVLGDTLQTDSASVSTVVDDQFVQNMPLNGRSFQSLIALVPGVVFTASLTEGSGQFSVNGQRSDANYFMVDGVSANFSSAPQCCLSQSLSGAIPGWTSGGGTNGLVSVDAMQEFRIQTSSYAPEFGRTPGAQISIVTKSGTNQFHGTAFDYLRNDFFDARNYFDAPPQIKPPLRQNDFGGVLGGPIIKNKTFFFFILRGAALAVAPDGAKSFLHGVRAGGGCAGLSANHQRFSSSNRPAHRPYLRQRDQSMQGEYFRGLVQSFQYQRHQHPRRPQRKHQNHFVCALQPRTIL
jgi:hypothetical protein